MPAVPRSARIALLVALCLVTGVVDALATHLAYGTLSWRRLLDDPGRPGQIRIRIEYEFGYDDDAFIFTTPPAVGDPLSTRNIQLTGTGLSEQYAVTEFVKYLSPADHLVVTGGVLELFVPVTAFPIAVYARADTRLHNLREGNNDLAQIFRMVIDPSRADRSPVAVPVPRIYVPRDALFNAQIHTLRGPGVSNAVTFAAAADSGLVTIAPNGTDACQSPGCPPSTAGSMQLNPNGEISWQPTIAGLYAAQFRIAANGPFSNELAAVPLDMTFEVVAPCATCRPRPEFTSPEPISVQPGTNVSMPISASSAATDRPAVTLIPLALPPNATFTQTNPGPNATGVLSWTPTTADSGTNLACFRAVDSQGLVNLGLYCATIDVWPTVTFNGRGGTPVPAAQSVEPGGYATQPTTDPTKAPDVASLFLPYYFIGWGPFDSDDGPPFPFQTFAITRDTELFAMWTSVRYTVSFDSTGGSAVPSQLVPKRTVPVEPVPPTRTGYSFGGWYQESSLQTLVSFVKYFGTPILRNTTFYAKWNANTYGVSFESNGGTSVPTQVVTSGATASAPVPPTRTGYTFAGWYSDAGLTQAFDFATTITADTTLYAKWTIDVYLVSFESNQGSAVGSQQVAYNNAASAPTPPTRTGYTFDGWYSDTGLSQPFSFATPITANLTLYAKWARLTYTFGGFLAPVDNLPIVNVGQAGRTFPLKWRLSNPDGTPVTALTSFVSFSDAPIACDAAPASVLEEQFATATSGIRYDAAADQFIYNWQTSRGARGCRLVTVTLDDGTSHYAKFELK